MDNLPLGADNKFAPFNRKEKSINIHTSLTTYDDYTIDIYEDVWEDMSEDDRIRIRSELKDYLKEDEIIESYEE